MTLTLAALVAVTGGLGAVARFALDYAVQRRVNSGGPLGILLVNVSASLLAGLVLGVASGATAPVFDDAVRFTLIAGFLGGYSTLSTVTVDTVQLVRAGRVAWVLANTLGMLALSVAAVIVGLAVSTWFV
jgi:CrcB protein